MNRNDRWLLPEGIAEIGPAEAERLERLRRTLLDLFSSWGYELVMPPFIDYLESLLTGTGHDLDLQTFKLTDQLSGRMLGVRADMTPQAARIDAHLLKRETPVRLCYMGTVLLARPYGINRTRSPLQVGAELYGFNGVESDVEVIQLMLEVLRLSGIQELHVDLGHVGIFRGLVKQAGLDSDQESVLFDALQRKALPELQEMLPGFGVSDDICAMFTALVELNGDSGVLDRARQKLAGAPDDVQRALDALTHIEASLRAACPDTPMYFDLAELRGYTYHTGAVFAAYVPGHGEAVAQGGRYDDIGRVFGHARPATGFSLDLKTLLELAADTSRPVGGIFAPADRDEALEQVIRTLRDKGQRVIRALPGQTGGAADMGCDRELRQEGGQWVVASLAGN